MHNVMFVMYTWNRWKLYLNYVKKKKLYDITAHVHLLNDSLTLYHPTFIFTHNIYKSLW